MESFFIKPKEGLLIRRPDNKKFLNPEGESVPKNMFWLRRIADGDVIEINLAKTEKSVNIKNKALKKKSTEKQGE